MHTGASSDAQSHVIRCTCHVIRCTAGTSSDAQRARHPMHIFFAERPKYQIIFNTLTILLISANLLLIYF
jgi:hypothetical protein